MHFVLDEAIRILKNTHRHPANWTLHCIGAPFYAAGITMICLNLAALDADLLAGLALWLVAVALFVSGHKIEGNLASMTPVLIFRLLSRKTGNYLDAHRVHLLCAWPWPIPEH
jgi:hypothetical protein